MATRRPREELSAIEQALSAERRLKSLKERKNAALLELDNPGSDRVKAMVSAAKLKKFIEYETQRAAIVGELSEGARSILEKSSDEFLFGKTPVQMRLMSGLPATGGKPTVSPGVPGKESILEPGDAEASMGTDTDKPAVPDGSRRGRPRT